MKDGEKQMNGKMHANEKRFTKLLRMTIFSDVQSPASICMYEVESDGHVVSSFNCAIYQCLSFCVLMCAYNT